MTPINYAGPVAQQYDRYTSAVAAHAHSITINNAGGSETVPKNTALMYCIKY
jgi:hypothetical protein